MSLPPLPSDRARLSPYVVVKGAQDALRFYTAAFGVKELYRLTSPDGKIGHAEVDFGGVRLMVADEHPDFGALAPPTIGGSPVSLHLYVADVDAVVAKATAAGATVLRAPRNEFYGDRSATVVDPFGHQWHLASRREEVTPAEMQRRMAEQYTS
jgi:PhnB protein